MPTRRKGSGGRTDAPMRFARVPGRAFGKQWPDELAGRGAGIGAGGANRHVPERFKQEGVAKASAFDPIVVLVLTAAMDARRSRLLDFNAQQLGAALEVCNKSGLYTADVEALLGWAIEQVGGAP